MFFCCFSFLSWSCSASFAFWAIARLVSSSSSCSLVNIGFLLPEPSGVPLPSPGLISESVFSADDVESSELSISSSSLPVSLLTLMRVSSTSFCCSSTSFLMSSRLLFRLSIFANMASFSPGSAVLSCDSSCSIDLDTSSSSDFVCLSAFCFLMRSSLASSISFCFFSSRFAFWRSIK